MRTPTLILAGTLAFGAIEAADEETPKTREQVERVFESLDRDEDQQISKTEARRRAELRERFAGVDASGDGYLSLSEYLARPSDERFE